MSHMLRTLSIGAACAALLLLSFSRPAAAEVRIGGRVLAPDGSVPRGVTVSLEPLVDEYQRLELRLAGKLGPPPVAETRLDADGYFELLAPRLGTWRVVAGGPGRLTMEFLFRPLLEAEELAPLELPPASPFEVRVVDPEGRPYAAAVGIYSRPESSRWRARPRLGRAADDGVVRLPRGPDEEVRLEVLAAGYPLLRDDPAPGKAWVGARLAAGVARTVQVHDRRERPLAGVLAYQGSGILPLGKTDAEGRLNLVIAAAEPAPVTFRAPGGPSASADLAVPANGEDTVAEVTLRPPLTLRGRVLDRESRDPVPEALVWASRGEATETDRRGGYVLVLPRVRRISVGATAPGYGLGTAVHTVEKDADSQTGPTVTLAPAAGVSGRVVDGEGIPIADVKIDVYVTGDGSPGRRRAASRWYTTSSRRGRFQLSHLEAQASHLFLFRKEGFAVARRRVETVQPSTVQPSAARPPLEVVLEAGRAGVGLVVDESETPLGGAEVRLVNPPSTNLFFDRDLPEFGQPSAVTTDAEGRFRIPDLGAGRYNLEVEAPGFSPLQIPGLRVADGTGEIDFGTVVLTAGATITGEVRDPQGTPIAGAEIRTEAADSSGFWDRREAEASTGDGGGFVLSGLRPGQALLILVSKPGYSAETSRVEASAGAPPLAIVLRPAARISGRVLDPEGDPIAGAYVSAYGEGRSLGMRPDRPDPTDAEGHFLIENVSPGKLRLSVHATSYQTYEMSGLEVAVGEELGGLEIVLRRGATVAGRITAADGRPVPQALVSVSQSGGSPGEGFSRSSSADDEGRYRIKAVSPGPAVLTALNGEHQQVSRTLELRPGTQSVDLTFEAGFEISGRVVGPDGALAGAVLRLQNSDSERGHFSFDRMTSTLSTADGTFLFPDVSAGSYTLFASKESFAEARTEEPFEVSGAVRGLVLELRRGATLRGRILGLELDDLGQVRIHAYEMTGDSPGITGSRRGQVDFEAQYTVAGLGPGEWTVQAQISGSSRQASGRVKVAPGDSEVHLDLEFKTGFTLRGEVTSAGQPLRSARVFLSGAESSGNSITDSEGRFRMDHLPSGPYHLTIYQGSIDHSEPLEILSDEEIRIDVATFYVSGYLRDKLDQSPIPGALLQLERIGTKDSFPWQSYGSGRSDSRGYFRVAAKEGIWRLRAIRAGYAPAEATVEIGPGIAGEEVVLELEAAEGISFSAVLASGTAPRRVQAAVLEAATDRFLAGGSYESIDGTFRISTVPAGSWELLIQAAGSAATRIAFTAPGHLGPIQLPAGGALRLNVPDAASSTGIAWVTLTGPGGKSFPLLGPSGAVSKEWPMHGGRTVLRNLAPGPWRFTVTHPDGRTWTGNATVAPGTSTEVTVP